MEIFLIGLISAIIFLFYIVYYIECKKIDRKYAREIERLEKLKSRNNKVLTYRKKVLNESYEQFLKLPSYHYMLYKSDKPMEDKYWIE